MNTLKQLINIYYRMIYIYKIYCKDENIKDCYIGSTNDIKIRIKNHEYSCYNENDEKYNQYKYIFIRENGGWCNWSYSIICECPSEDRYTIERWHIENTKDTNLNKSIPLRSVQEWSEANKKKLKEYRELNKNKMKEYRELNKNKIKEQCKQYRELNKNKIKEIKNKKYECECGGKHTHANRIQHLKTQKHLKYIESLNINKI